jgi:hypothetical protein
VPHTTVEPAGKFDPFTVSVKSFAPAAIVEGLSVVIAGPVTVNTIVVAELTLLVFRTEILTVPAVASCVLVTAAVSLVLGLELSGVVTSGVVPHMTVERVTKFPPLTVSVNGSDPATAEVTPRVEPLSKDVSDGLATVKLVAAVLAPPGFCTVTLTDAAAASSEAATGAVSLVELT